MTDPLTWTFIKFVETCLQNISTSNGYHTNAGSNVLLEVYSLNDETDEFPTLRITEDDSDESNSGRGYTDNEVRITIESYQRNAGDETAQLNAHKIRSDIKKALPKKSKEMPVGVGSMEVVSARLIQPRDGMPFLVTQVALRARLTESNQPA